MATKTLSKEKQNVIRLSIAFKDGIQQPLADILVSEIQPKDLHNKIISSPSLMNGNYKLKPEQLKICCLAPPATPNYNDFDVTLLYKLITHLCSAIQPPKGWGKCPTDAETDIGNDIERLRLFRNSFAHDTQSEIPDAKFEVHWKNLKKVMQRIQKYLLVKGLNPNYEQLLLNISQLNLGDEDPDKYKHYYLTEYAFDLIFQNCDKNPDIFIEGVGDVMCGDTARFKAVINPEKPKGWSVSWQKRNNGMLTQIHTDYQRYNGSNDYQLVINSVCKDDNGEYIAILSKESDDPKLNIYSNKIVLNALGEKPVFNVWKVTTGMDNIFIHYQIKKDLPAVFEIKWTKDERLLDCKNDKYNGGGLNDTYFSIKLPSQEDAGKYACSVKNAVGTTTEDFTFDIPKVQIPSEKSVVFGSKTTFVPEISSCPVPDGVEWQTSVDGDTFDRIDISKPKYFNSSCNPEKPILEIPKVTFADKFYYRLLAWNKIGATKSNIAHLNVTGDYPNIITSHRTYIQNKSIELNVDIFLHGNHPKVQEVFWTKNGEKLDIKGSGGRYTEVSLNNPSLTIFGVNEYDAGSYQLTAFNDVGANKSDVIVLDVPYVLIQKSEEKEDGSQLFRVTVKSIPAAFRAQWSMKEKNGDKFKPIDGTNEEYKGTSNSLPHPELVVKHKDWLNIYSFEIEVYNFIGSAKETISDNINLQSPNTGKSKVGCLGKFYRRRKHELSFADLFDELAEQFPQGKVDQLKDFIKNSNIDLDVRLFKPLETARDCIRILRDQAIFTDHDVIFIQYLLKRTKCEELYNRCLEYAENNRALCFYEKQLEEGYKKVQFHVKVVLSAYTKDEIEDIKETVAAIVKCDPKEIFVNGCRPSSSFFVVLSMKDVHIQKMLTISDQDKETLSHLKIDYFIVDFIIVYLTRPKELRRIVFDATNTPIQEKEMWKKTKSDESSPQTNTLNLPHTAQIIMSTEGVNHISCLMHGRMWVSGFDTIEEIDEIGHVLRKWDMNFGVFGSHSLTKNGDLLFLKDGFVYKLTYSGRLQNLSIPSTQHFCIHSSQINGNILVGDIYKVRRYSESGKKIQEIEVDNDGECLYAETIYITENMNRDIIVSDCGKEAVVVVNKAGQHRFNYTGHHPLYEFHPRDVCTDESGNILVCNFFGDPGVHLIDRDGQFLTYLKTNNNCSFGYPTAVCVDRKHALYVGYSNTRRIDVYQYQLASILKECVNEKPEEEGKQKIK